MVLDVAEVLWEFITFCREVILKLFNLTLQISYLYFVFVAIVVVVVYFVLYSRFIAFVFLVILRFNRFAITIWGMFMSKSHFRGFRQF